MATLWQKTIFVMEVTFNKEIIFGINLTNCKYNATNMNLVILSGNFLLRYPVNYHTSSLSSKSSRKFYINI